MIAKREYPEPYKFEFENAITIDFNVVLDEHSLELLGANDGPKPEWTRLGFSQCENCPLSKDVEYCPVAVNLSKIVDTFRTSLSFESTVVTVKTPERTYVISREALL